MSSGGQYIDRGYYLYGPYGMRYRPYPMYKPQDYNPEPMSPPRKIELTDAQKESMDTWMRETGAAISGMTVELYQELDKLISRIGRWGNSWFAW